MAFDDIYRWARSQPDKAAMIYNGQTLSYASLARAIDGLISNQDLQTTLGHRARERCVKLYSWDAMEAPLDEVVRMAGTGHWRRPWRWLRPL